MKNTYLSLFRHILTIAGGMVVANNPHISETVVQTGSGVALAAVGALWGMIDEHLAEKKTKVSQFDR